MSEDSANNPSTVHSLIREVQLLLDFISGLTNRRLKDLEVSCPDSACAPDQIKKLKGEQVIARLEEIVAGYDKDIALQPTNIAFLKLLKDELVQMAAPATGLTVAYTAMVVGSGRKKEGRELPKDRVDYAQAAYPALMSAAHRHRVGHLFILALALALALITVSESARVALGKALLQTRQELRIQQAAIA